MKDDALGLILTIASGIGALVALYLIIGNGQSVTAIAGTVTNFGVAETKALQGR